MDMTDVLKMMINSGAAEEVSKETGISVTDAAEVMEDLLPILLKQGTRRHRTDS